MCTGLLRYIMYSVILKHPGTTHLQYSCKRENLMQEIAIATMRF